MYKTENSEEIFMLYINKLCCKYSLFDMIYDAWVVAQPVKKIAPLFLLMPVLSEKFLLLVQ